VRHRSRTGLAAIVAATLGVGLLAGAPRGAAAAGEADAADAPLVIGQLAPQTGELAPILDSLRAPVQLAIDEVNAAGGVNGAPVGFVPGDEGDDVATARTAVTGMLDFGVDAIVGPASSSTALAILKTTKGASIVCSGSNTSDTLTTEGPRRSGGLYFRTSPPDRFQGPALAEQIVADGHRRVAVLARDDAYGDTFTATLPRALGDRGAKVTVVRYDPARDDLAAPVRKALASDPDAVAVVGLRDDAAAAVRALVAAGSGPQQRPIYGTDGLYSSGFAELVDPVNPGVVAGLMGTAPAAAPAGVASPFHGAFAATGIDPVFSAHAYDCTILTALAAVKAGSDDPRRMARAFRANLEGERDCDTFASCRDLLEAGETIHWRGASSRFERFGRFEPREGVYQPWTYDADGIPRDDDPTTQVTIS
jgi:branched-chain amino acid transport system substrate-binding protein